MKSIISFAIVFSFSTGFIAQDATNSGYFGEADVAGFRPIFDGRTLSGWKCVDFVVPAVAAIVERGLLGLVEFVETESHHVLDTRAKAANRRNRQNRDCQ
ncbi:hypothetical protein OAF98_06090 [Planctomicrobium sp.]|jgi:hypothetical protein|nr:hypothetical protein [Planctomicrobium sp.]MDB4744040.1 hypothetical protein [Planctomicrobium sp.]